MMELNLKICNLKVLSFLHLLLNFINLKSILRDFTKWPLRERMLSYFATIRLVLRLSIVIISSYNLRLWFVIFGGTQTGNGHSYTLPTRY